MVSPYGGGWTVEVEPSGLISGTYSYLYNEAQTKNLFQYSSGGVIRRDTFVDFFSHFLHAAGFNDNETADFVEYWSPRLTSSQFCLVYPRQTADLEKMIALRVTPVPESKLRLTYVIRPTPKEDAIMNAPRLARVLRQGSTLMKWAVVLE